jgi:hypothetical protein
LKSLEKIAVVLGWEFVRVTIARPTNKATTDFSPAEQFGGGLFLREWH